MIHVLVAKRARQVLLYWATLQESNIPQLASKHLTLTLGLRVEGEG